jgi:7-cyano-7-deazaguanine reductase
MEQHIKADGEVFSFLPQSEIKPEYLKTFDFESREQQVNITYPEFSAVCPFSGLPDIATLNVSYYPDGGKAIELKSLKYYLTSFRPVGIYQEAVTARIYEDLKAVLNTKRLQVITNYNVRGGMGVICSEGTLYNPYSVTSTGKSISINTGSGYTTTGGVTIYPSGLQATEYQ